VFEGIGMFSKKDTYFGEDFTAELCEVKKQKTPRQSGVFLY
jgi:hypothetical protein